MVVLQVLLSLAFASGSGASSVCAPMPSAVGKAFDSLQKTMLNPYNAFCTDVKAVIEKKEPSNIPICSAFWKDDRAPWVQPPPKYPMIEDSAVELGQGGIFGYRRVSQGQPAPEGATSGYTYGYGYVVPSRDQMKALGYKYVDQKESLKGEQAFNVTKKRVASSCCGADQDCQKTFLATPVYYCSGARDDDSKSPDGCANSGNLTAYFSAEPEARMQSEWHGKKYDKLDPVERQRTLDQIRKSFPRFDPKKVAAGYIMLPRYSHPAYGKRDDYVLRHELGHACVFVRQQVANIKGTKNIAMDAFSGQGDNANAFCQYREGTFENLNLFNSLLPGKDVSAVKNCVANAIKAEIQDPKNIGYLKDACFGSKYEEALGDVFSALTATDDDHHNVMASLCTNAPSHVHFAGTSTFECLIKYAPGYAEKLYRGASCSRHSYLPVQ